MRIIDLTHTIAENMAVFPGTERPRLQAANTYEKDGFRETLLTLYSHTGTHMDAPSHIIDGRTTLDALPVSQFVGTGLVIDCTDLSAGQSITMERINRARDRAERAEFLLFNTGWSARWGTEAYFGDYPCITAEVAQYIVDGQKKGVGFDVISVDPIVESTFPLHRRLFAGTDIVIIENLANLHLIGGELFTFCALPLKFSFSDGAPIRAIAMLNNG